MNDGTLSKLERLHGLLQDGALTQDEFDEQKQALLQADDLPEQSNVETPTVPSSTPSYGRAVGATLLFIPSLYATWQIFVGGLQASGGGGGGDVIGLACVGSPLLIVVGTYAWYMRRWLRLGARLSNGTNGP